MPIERVICSPYVPFYNDSKQVFDDIHGKVYGRVLRSVKHDESVMSIDYELCDMADPTVDPIVIGALWVHELEDHIPIVVWQNKTWRIINKLVNELRMLGKKHD